MKLDSTNLPDDPQQLKSLLIELNDRHQDQLHQLHQLHQQHEEKYQALEEKYLTLQRKFFGRSSEKLSAEDQNQLRLFNEAEMEVDNSFPERPIVDSETIVIKEHARQKRGRKKLPDDLPREDVIHDLSDEDKQCPCCHKERPRIGQDETEELDIIPARIKVLRHIKLKYGPCGCTDFLNREIPEVITAPQPARIIPGSIVSPGLLAYVITSKYVDSMPFYRQSKIFERIDIELSRATLCNWAMLAAEKCKPLIECMKNEIKSGPFIQMDETTVQVLQEEGRDPTRKSYMWVTVGYPQTNKPLVLFDYHPTRSQNVPLHLLDGYKGYLQTDGYAGYNSIGTQSGITHVGCFAHARRYFHDAMKLSKKSKTAAKGIAYIQKLYVIERELREQELTPEVFIEKRQKQAEPVLTEFYTWLQEKNMYITPESKAGKAVQYTLNEWNKLVRYLEKSFLSPDNNRVENAIRPFVVGRKNWLFSNTPRGAHSSAVLYSLVESAKANKLEPYQYLRYLFTKMPAYSSSDDIKLLLPCYLSKKNLIIT